MSSVIPSKAKTNMPVFPIRCVKVAIISPKEVAVSGIVVATPTFNICTCYV